MPAPRPKDFAKLVLWHLAGLRADMRQFRHQYITHIAATSKIPVAALERQWKIQHRRLRDTIYKEAIEEAGLDEDNPTPRRRR
jgi:hypothetical protein